jgi:hypothetical protein
VKNGIKITVLSWDANRSWTDWDGKARYQLVPRLVEFGQQPRLEAKRLARRIMARELVSLTLPSDKGVEGIRHVLESLGAEVEIKWL